jgi:mannose-6-phosphate isomerase-like protein (cupin superfamily)
VKEEGSEMALQTMQKKNLNNPDETDVHGKIKKETVTLDTVEVTRVTFEVGAKWSNDLKDYAGTESCELPHVALIQSGRLKVVMDDGSEEEFGPGDIMLLPPGHDAWTLGEEACVFVEFSQGKDYYAH